MSVMEKLLILSGTLWLSAIAFIAYAWILQARQRTILRYIASRLTKIEQMLATEETHQKTVATKTVRPISSKETNEEPAPNPIITINKNEPLSKYENVTLPDNIDINFVD